MPHAVRSTVGEEIPEPCVQGSERSTHSQDQRGALLSDKEPRYSHVSSGFLAEYSAVKSQHLPSRVVQSMTALVISIRQENPIWIDRASAATRL